MEDDGECLITTVGFMLEEGSPGTKKEHLSLFQTLTDGEVIHPFYVPKGMVRKVVSLGPLKEIVDESITGI